MSDNVSGIECVRYPVVVSCLWSLLSACCWFAENNIQFYLPSVQWIKNGWKPDYPTDKHQTDFSEDLKLDITVCSLMQRLQRDEL